jgi:hypothetical protein
MNYKRYIAILLSLFVTSASYAASSAQEAALEYVTRQNLGDNLSRMASGMAIRTNTFATLVEKLGADGAKASVSRELQMSLPKYQSRWNRNLANAYAKNFSAEELTSLAKEGRGSKHFAKVMERQNTVGTEMRATSESVLTEYIAEALNNSLSKASK